MTQTDKPAPSSKPANADDVRPLVSGERVRVNKLNKDMTAVLQSIQTTGPSQFQQASHVEALQKRFAQFTEALGRYPQLQDEDVATARRSYAQLQQGLQAEYQRARTQLEKLGDVQGRLTQLQTQIAQYPAPAPLVAPFDQSAVADWLASASSSRSAAENAYTQLQTIASEAYLPETRGLPSQGADFELEDVQRLIAQTQIQFQGAQQSYVDTVEPLKQAMAQVEAEMSSRWQEDPEAEDKRWIFLDEQQQLEASELFAHAKRLSESFQALESALGRDTSAGDQLAERATLAVQSFSAKQETALATSRMPAAVSTNQELLDIAQSILANPSYEFGAPGRIALTTDQIITRERKDSEVEFDDVDVSVSGDIKLSGTQTTWTYRWQEFKFAVPLRDDSQDKWHIWWITARNYSSGDTTTPIGKWISGSTTKGNQILEQHTR